MGKHHNPYAPEFRAQMVELVKAGRSPEELAREFERDCANNLQLGRTIGSRQRQAA